MIFFVLGESSGLERMPFFIPFFSYVADMYEETGHILLFFFSRIYLFVFVGTIARKQRFCVYFADVFVPGGMNNIERGGCL